MHGFAPMRRGRQHGERQRAVVGDTWFRSRASSRMREAAFFFVAEIKLVLARPPKR